MVTVYLPKNSFPFGGIILLFAIAMVTLIAASALANEPYKFLRYEIITIYHNILTKLCSLIGMDYSTEMVNLPLLITSISLYGKLHSLFCYLWLWSLPFYFFYIFSTV